jgi:hypothetical protein
MALEDLGITSDEAERAVRLFAEYDERNLVESHAYYDDERQLIQSAKQAADELTDLFEADQREREQPRAAE